MCSGLAQGHLLVLLLVVLLQIFKAINQARLQHQDTNHTHLPGLICLWKQLPVILGLAQLIQRQQVIIGHDAHL